MKFSQDKLKTAEMLAELSSIILNDTKNSRQLYVNMYLNELPPTMKRQISDPHIKLNFDVQKFPDVPMYERIVAMNIPHLYDVNVNEVQVANFDDLNSFPPLLPNSPSLLSSERFSTVCQLFKKFKCEPFSSYSDILNKLHTALVDVDALNVMKLCEKINTFPILHIFSEALMEYDQKNVQTRDIEEEEILEQPEEFHYEDFITVVTDPYEFVMVTPGSFVPSLDEINCIGLDLMDGMEKF
ncbi:hypothetical protein TRFO_10753 [Tritrichomonas foetus]|uniref:Uncharacterized protein n=1 Tax=Tritrichomonas foetus TaxID=1144522 RepID=A0A1J4JCN2_9EUKA|nr:hypothetical protein TRFO_10753 [Tritrichomonas foetus]|eukprot:OHS95036.1 hypothetical protein TRFO_10753 [Tritrichomonas foetus]